MFHARPVLVGFLAAMCALDAHAFITSRTFTVTARHSYFESFSGTPIERVLDEQVRTFSGLGLATATVEAPMPDLFDVDFVGPAFAKASARVIDVGDDGSLVITNTYVTGQGVSTPSPPYAPVLTSLVEDVAVGRAPVGSPVEGGLKILYSFDLKDISAEIWDHRLSTDPLALPLVELRYTVELNGMVKYMVNAAVVGDRDSHRVDQIGIDGVDFRERPVAAALDIRSETVGAGGVPRVIVFEEKSVRFLDLGTVEAGESYEVKATMMARLSVPGLIFEIGGRGNIGDPNGISGVGLGQITLAPVPELSMIWLFLGGGGVLAFFRRRAW